MTATILSLSEARARRNRRAFKAIGLQDYTLGAWLSAEHQSVMGPHTPTLPCGSVPADLIEPPCDTEPA
jgi:hypothetical protein